MLKQQREREREGERYACCTHPANKLQRLIRSQTISFCMSGCGGMCTNHPVAGGWVHTSVTSSSLQKKPQKKEDGLVSCCCKLLQRYRCCGRFARIAPQPSSPHGPQHLSTAPYPLQDILRGPAWRPAVDWAPARPPRRPSTHAENFHDFTMFWCMR